MTQTKPGKVLANVTKIRDDKLERFLLDLANAHADESADDTLRIFRLYWQFLPHPPGTPEEAVPLLPVFSGYFGKRGELLPKEPLVYQRGIIAGLRDWLQEIWKADDEYTAEWRRLHFRSEMKKVMPLPTDAPLAQALTYLWRQLGKLKTCANPACISPFFIAARRERRCCQSPMCVTALRREYKSRWWCGKLKKVDDSNQPEGQPVVDTGGAPNRETHGERPRIAEPALKAFMLDVVNADDSKINDRKMYFFTHYPEFFPTRDADTEAALPRFQRRWTTPEGLRMEVPLIYHRAEIGILRDGLRAAWQAEDRAAAEEHIFEAQFELHGIMDVHSRQDWRLQPPSTDAPIHQALDGSANTSRS